MAYQDGERAKKMENPTLRGPLKERSQSVTCRPGGEARGGTQRARKRAEAVYPMIFGVVLRLAQRVDD
jgi:hypothetical protein